MSARGYTFLAALAFCTAFWTTAYILAPQATVTVVLVMVFGGVALGLRGPV